MLLRPLEQLAPIRTFTIQIKPPSPPQLFLNTVACARALHHHRRPHRLHRYLYRRPFLRTALPPVSLRASHLPVVSYCRTSLTQQRSSFIHPPLVCC